MNIFTYGSLMFPEVWLRVAGAMFPSQSATLVDYEARKVRGETYPGLIHAPGERTQGIVYFDVGDEAVARLDAFEGSFYARIAVTVRLGDGRAIIAEVYLVRGGFEDSLSDERWDMEEFRARHLDSFIGPRSP